MAHFSLENEVSNILKHDAPLSKGPVPRWQRKALESSLNNISMNMSHNDSLMNKSLNRSAKKGPSPKKNVLEEWKKHISPGRNGPRGIDPGDRFIPNRSAMRFDLANYLVNKGGENKEENLSPNKAEYRKQLSENLLGVDISNNCRILAYQNKAPQAPTGHANGLKVLYSSSKDPNSSKKTNRFIPQNPERILDAPEILDDYYLNLVDWSSSNILAVALHKSLYLWNGTSGDIQQLLELPNQEDYISCVSWLPEGTVLAVGTGEAEIQLWDVAENKRIRTMKSHVGRIPALSWNSYILSSGSRSGVIHHHDVRVADHHVGTLSGHQQEVCGLRWSPEGRYLASGGNDNLVNIWTGTNSSQPVHTFNEHQAAVKALAWCPWQQNVLATGGGTADRHIRFWNCNLGSSLNCIDAKSQVCALLWSKEYKELISAHGFANNQLIIWKYPQMSKVCELTGHQQRVLSLCMSPDGQTVVSAGADETLRLWKCFAVDPTKKKAEAKAASHRSEFIKHTIR